MANVKAKRVNLEKVLVIIYQEFQLMEMIHSVVQLMVVFKCGKVNHLLKIWVASMLRFVIALQLLKIMYSLVEEMVYFSYSQKIMKKSNQ